MRKTDLLEVVLQSLLTHKQRSEYVLGQTHRAIDESPGPSQSHSDTTRFQTTEVVKEMAKAAEGQSKTIAILGYFKTDPALSRHSEAIELGALARVDFGGIVEDYFVLPDGAGTSVEFENVEVCVVTPASPLGQSLLGKRMGDEFDFVANNRSTRIKVLEIF